MLNNKKDLLTIKDHMTISMGLEESKQRRNKPKQGCWAHSLHSGSRRRALRVYQSQAHSGGKEDEVGNIRVSSLKADWRHMAAVIIWLCCNSLISFASTYSIPPNKWHL